MTAPALEIIEEIERLGKPAGEQEAESLCVSEVVVTLQGRLLEARVVGADFGGQDPEQEKRAGQGGVRGVVSGAEMSRGSRRRLQKMLARVEGQEGDFLRTWTLTFAPEVVPGTAEGAKACLRAWIKRALRRYPGLVIVWRLEPQKCGRPHFHLLTWGAYIPHAEAWEWWREITGAGIKRAFVYVEAVRSWKRAAQYVSKYVSKAVKSWLEEEGQEGEAAPIAADESPGGSGRGVGAATSLDLRTYWAAAGRLWGVENRELLPLGELVEVRVSLRAYYRLRRAARHAWRGVGTRRYCGFSLFTDDLGSWGVLVGSLVG